MMIDGGLIVSLHINPATASGLSVKDSNYCYNSQALNTRLGPFVPWWIHWGYAKVM